MPQLPEHDELTSGERDSFVVSNPAWRNESAPLTHASLLEGIRLLREHLDRPVTPIGIDPARLFPDEPGQLPRFVLLRRTGPAPGDLGEILELVDGRYLPMQDQ